MIAEGVEHHVAAPEAGGEQAARGAPRIGHGGFRLEDRSWRREEASERSWRVGYEAAEGEGGLLQGRQLGLAQNGQARQRLAAGDAGKIDALADAPHRPEIALPASRSPAAAAKERAFALSGIAGFESIVVICQEHVPRSTELVFVDTPSMVRRCVRYGVPSPREWPGQARAICGVRKRCLQGIRSELVRADGSPLAEEHDQDDGSDKRNEAEQQPPARFIRVVQAAHASGDARNDQRQRGDQVEKRHIAEDDGVQNARDDVHDRP